MTIHFLVITNNPDLTFTITFNSQFDSFIKLRFEGLRVATPNLSLLVLYWKRIKFVLYAIMSPPPFNYLPFSIFNNMDGLPVSMIGLEMEVKEPRASLFLNDL